jgi:hypothetical protein
MRGFPKWNFPTFDRNAQFLADSGWDPVSPADLDRKMGFDENDDGALFGEAEFHEAMLRDYEALLRCSAIAFIPGWEKSTGAALERSFAGRLKLDMYRVDADNSYLEKELLIGLTGFARTGKDSLAQELVKGYGFQRKGFADNLRSILYALNPRLPDPNWGEVGDNFGSNGVVRIKDYVDRFGWEKSKEVSEIRQLLQRLGTDGGREYLGVNVWVDSLINGAHNARLVVPDVRFPNEYQAIKERGGIVIRIIRDGYAPVNSHISETALQKQDYVISNDGSTQRLLDQALQCLEMAGIDV